MHDIVIGLFVNRYAFGMVVEQGHLHFRNTTQAWNPLRLKGYTCTRGERGLVVALYHVHAAVIKKGQSSGRCHRLCAVYRP